MVESAVLKYSGGGTLVAGADSCPCGAHVNPSYQAIDYLIGELLPDIIPNDVVRGTYLPLIISFIQQATDFGDMCANPRIDRPRDFTPFDWINPAIGAVLAYEWLLYRLYELVCICDDCPPIAGCSSGVCYNLSNTNGVNTFPDDGVWELQQPDGTWYVLRSDNTCLGPYTGLDIIWHMDPVFDPSRGISVGNYNGTGYTSWSQNTYSGAVLACTGGAQQDPQPVPWPPVPGDIAPLPGPAPCTDSDICVVLDEIAEMVREVRFLTEVTAGPLYGVTTPYQFNLPGLNTPIQGTLAEALPRALEALAPLQPSQLVNESIIPISTSTSITLTGLAYLEITPTTVPGTFGAYGEPPTRVFHSRTRSPSPGYALVLGQQGVLDQRFILWDQGIEIVVPSTATDLLLHLEPGVEVDVVTYERHV